ncbi:YlxR family protein [Actinomadura keratinilytica]|uniref:YlxR family protein n=1 Tax=Actinomadura keratinilytica TaxID=547461 RepID=UPI00361DF113
MRQVPPTPRRGRLESRERAAPLRTCVGCRVRTAKSELLRLVAVEGVIVPDPRGRMPGRGRICTPIPDVSSSQSGVGRSPGPSAWRGRSTPPRCERGLRRGRRGSRMANGKRRLVGSRSRLL